MKPRFGTVNFVNMEGYKNYRKKSNLDPYDPLTVKEDLKITEISEELFPLLTTGVRFWPFLFVVRDLQNRRSKDKIVQVLEKLRKAQGGRRIGPGTYQTYSYYLSMYNKIMDNDADKWLEKAKNDLRGFISDRRTKYSGDLKLFKIHEKKWKKLIRKSMGTASKQLAYLIDENDNLEDYIKHIITKSSVNGKTINPKLKHASFCYVLLRCLYGVKTPNGIGKVEEAASWIGVLKKILEKNGPAVPEEWLKYQKFLDEHDRKPRFEHIRKKLEGEGRRFLANLRLNIFYNLYKNPTPSRI